MLSRTVARLTAVAVICFVSMGHAANIQFLESAPAGQFDDRDWELLREAVVELLDDADDGATGTWKNENNGHHGELVLIRSYEEFGTICRRVKITNEAGDFKATSMRDLCKDKEGKWKVLK